MGTGQVMWNMQLKGLHMCSQVLNLFSACQRGSLQPFQVWRYLLASPSMATSSQLQPVNLAPNHLCSPRSSNSGIPLGVWPIVCAAVSFSPSHIHSGSCTQISAGAPPTGSRCSIILLFEGIAESTHKTYQSALCRFAAWRQWWIHQWLVLTRQFFVTCSTSKNRKQPTIYTATQLYNSHPQ